jgi:hypothetical protein
MVEIARIDLNMMWDLELGTRVKPALNSTLLLCEPTSHRI